ncbi:3-deoxy-manno-octulosonate cytidylyltransferase [Dokdonella sp.]|uniref:3-deoxy-manno-octulosonate cytidylyltransferase n=1 Tax=Dokdonella sp. TaxID=2291710 RepID=UPI0035276559
MKPEIDFVVAIPARYGSQRLPGKPLRLIAGDPMILHVARRALQAGASEVVVATDDQRIVDALEGSGVAATLTRSEHASGSDRLAELAELRGWDDARIVVNLQGDEPLAPASGIRAVAEALASGNCPMATLATPVLTAEELFDPNCVKLVRDASCNALYFSRAPIPWARDTFAQSRETLPADTNFLRHIGIYAYRAGFLKLLAGMSRTPLEIAESLEQLRAIEHGCPITVALAPEPFPAGVDTAEDLARVERLLADKATA